MTLDFRDELVNNRWSWGNNFVYGNAVSSGIMYPKDYPEAPFILKSGFSWHPAESGVVEMKFADAQQLNGRALTTARIKEVLDGPRMPLRFSVGALLYLIGKGFLAKYNDAGNIEVLFLAIAPKDRVLSMSEVKFYVSRSLYLPEHKKFHNAMKDILSLHTGETILTNNIGKYVGCAINIPNFTSISQKKKFVSDLVIKCLEESYKDFKPVGMVKKPLDKKKKEAEILQAIRTAVEEVAIETVTTEITYSADALPEDYEDYLDEGNAEIEEADNSIEF